LADVFLFTRMKSKDSRDAITKRTKQNQRRPMRPGESSEVADMKWVRDTFDEIFDAGEPGPLPVQTTLDAAREYVRRGFRVVPVPRGEKGPRIAGWQNLRLADADLSKNFHDGKNVGVLTGEASGLADVDLDCPEAHRLAPTFLPATQMIHGRSGNPQSHFWYRVSPSPKHAKFDDPIRSKSDPKKATLVELRSDEHQTIVPPSVHPSGERLSWVQFGDPATVDSDLLSIGVAKIAAASLLARYWPQPGRRHDVALSLAGMLLRAGWEEEQAAYFIEAVARTAGDEESRQRARDVATTARRLAAGDTATGARRLGEIVGDVIVARMRNWLDIPSPRVELSSLALTGGTTPWPAPLAQEAFHGLTGQIVRSIEPHTESDPAALLIQFLDMFGSVIGPSAYFTVEADKHRANLFVVLVGSTSKGRKGTSLGHIQRLFAQADPEWAKERIAGGLSSGEGLIWAVRDPVTHKKDVIDKEGNVTGQKEVEDEPGIADKRLLVVESEFASPLKVLSREGNNLSAAIRQAWDNGNLRILNKNTPAKATGAFISILGHITRDELVRLLDSTEASNGFGNRFLWVCVKRSKILPEGGNFRLEKHQELMNRLGASIEFARQFRELRRDEEARKAWFHVYGELSEGKPGLFGSMTSRAEAQVVRLSLVYALLDCSEIIKLEHTLAALAVWEYCEASARYIFGDALGDPVADRILAALRNSPEGLNRTEINTLFKGHQQEAEISKALAKLDEYGLARKQKHPTEGRSAERWCSLGGAKEAK
jgi:hypothetical protein